MFAGAATFGEERNAARSVSPTVHAKPRGTLNEPSAARTRRGRRGCGAEGGRLSATAVMLHAMSELGVGLAGASQLSASQWYSSCDLNATSRAGVVTWYFCMTMIKSGNDIPARVLARLPKWALLEDLPVDAQNEVRRILDAEARRLLGEAGSDGCRIRSHRAGATRGGDPQQAPEPAARVLARSD